MNKSNKAIITFILATLTPTFAWMVFTPFVVLMVIFLANRQDVLGADTPLPALILGSLILVIMTYMWTFFFAIFVFIVSVIHIFFLALPIFLAANYLKIIRWYTVLPASFLIGGIPSILFTLGSPTDVVLSVTTVLGIFGFSAGVVFWLLWRYWVSREIHATVDASIATLVPYE